MRPDVLSSLILVGAVGCTQPTTYLDTNGGGLGYVGGFHPMVVTLAVEDGETYRYEMESNVADTGERTFRSGGEGGAVYRGQAGPDCIAGSIVLRLDELSTTRSIGPSNADVIKEDSVPVSTDGTAVHGTFVYGPFSDVHAWTGDVQLQLLESAAERWVVQITGDYRFGYGPDEVHLSPSSATLTVEGDILLSASTDARPPRPSDISMDAENGEPLCVWDEVTRDADCPGCSP